MTKDVTDGAKAPTYAELLALLEEARDHLNYCGYGDSWERECANDSKLPERLDAAITKAANQGGPTGSPEITPRVKTAAEALATEDRWPADIWGNPSFLSTFAPGYYRRAAAVVAALENTNG